MKTLLLIDDHKMIRDAIKQYLVGNEDYQITAEAANGKEALDLLHERNFDIVVSDVHMPLMNGMELMENIHLNFPGQAVLILSIEESKSTIHKILSFGARGYVTKNVKRDELLLALDTIGNSKRYFSKEISIQVKEILADVTEKRDRAGNKPEVSLIEHKILKMLIGESSIASIAKKVDVAMYIVQMFIDKIYRKAQCKSLPGLTVYAVEHNLI